KLGGLPDGGIEKLDLIAAEFLDALAADGTIGLREDMDARAVEEFEAALGGRGFEEGGEVALDELEKTCVHFFRLLEGAAKNTDLDTGLEEEIEEGGDGADGG